MPPTTCSCSEFNTPAVSRRGLFRGAALAGATSAFGTAIVTTSGAAAAATPASSVMVVLSLRGAADGLSLVVPHGDPTYYASRPTIAVPRSSLLAQDAFFGLHPALLPLLPLWNAARLAAVHATGLPVANRSHFSAMEELEDADPGSPERIGWLNRLVGQSPDATAAQGLSVGTSIPPASMAGPTPVMSIKNLSAVESLAGGALNPESPRLRSLSTVWGDSPSAYGAGVRSALAGVRQLLPAAEQVDRGTTYPNSDLGRALAAVARTLRADVGVSTVTVDDGDWDMHTGIGNTRLGRLLNNTRDLAASIAAFFDDLGPVADKVTLVTISEFGRRVAENANGGLDHGWGNVMLLAGAGVRGGRYYGTWPGLTNQLDSDLRVTTDYRSVLSEVVTKRMGASSAAVFPGFQPERVGVMTAL